MFDDLHAGKLNMGRLNYGVIILIPKLAMNVIKQYRPICLLNVIFKIITKALTGRLTKVAEKIVSATQTAFIPGRHILEGVSVLHEVVHEIQKTKATGIILKLDFEKAYDKVQWTFLREVLKGKGLSCQWVSWIDLAVQTGKVCVNLNGENGGITSELFKVCVSAIHFLPFSLTRWQMLREPLLCQLEEVDT